VATTTESEHGPAVNPVASGIIVPTPDAEAVVGPLRWAHDPQARRGVPAHITLLYPFAPPSEVDQEIADLRHLFREIAAFEFSLVEVRRFPAAAYLHPEPTAPLLELTEMLVRRWPAFPPYGGAFSTVIPHLTIADQASSDVLDLVDRQVTAHLPIRCRATEAWLLCSDDQGVWTCREVFPFRAAIRT
jgi:2'-5' RNA ligase